MIEMSDIANIFLLVLGSGIVILALIMGFRSAAIERKIREDMKKADSCIMQTQTTIEKSLGEIEKKLNIKAES